MFRNFSRRLIRLTREQALWFTQQLTPVPLDSRFQPLAPNDTREARLGIPFLSFLMGSYVMQAGFAYKFVADQELTALILANAPYPRESDLGQVGSLLREFHSAFPDRHPTYTTIDTQYECLAAAAWGFRIFSISHLGVLAAAYGGGTDVQASDFGVVPGVDHIVTAFVTSRPEAQAFANRYTPHAEDAANKALRRELLKRGLREGLQLRPSFAGTLQEQHPDLHAEWRARPLAASRPVAASA